MRLLYGGKTGLRVTGGCGETAMLLVGGIDIEVQVGKKSINRSVFSGWSSVTSDDLVAYRISGQQEGFC